MAHDPRVTRTPHGWLAVAPEGESPRIGVVGTTEEEARSRFHHISFLRNPDTWFEGIRRQET